ELQKSLPPEVVSEIQFLKQAEQRSVFPRGKSMSKRKRERNRKVPEIVGLGLSSNDSRADAAISDNRQSRLWMFALVGLLSIGVFGAGLNYFQTGTKNAK